MFLLKIVLVFIFLLFYMEKNFFFFFGVWIIVFKKISNEYF